MSFLSDVPLPLCNTTDELPTHTHKPPNHPPTPLLSFLPFASTHRERRDSVMHGIARCAARSIIVPITRCTIVIAAVGYAVRGLLAFCPRTGDARRLVPHSAVNCAEERSRARCVNSIVGVSIITGGQRVRKHEKGVAP